MEDEFGYFDDAEINNGTGGFQDNSEQTDFDTTSQEDYQYEENPFADFVAEKFGIEDYRILSGDANNPIEIDIRDMSPKQLKALVKELEQDTTSNSGLSEEESLVLEMLRENRLEDLHKELEKELGYSNTSEMSSSQFTDDQIAYWKITSEFPELSEEEVLEELEALKDSPTYTTKIKKYRESWNNEMSQQSSLIAKSKEQEVYQDFTQASIELKNMLDTVDNHYGFEVSDAVRKEVLDELTTFDKTTGTTMFIKNYIDNPQGLLEAAIAVKNMPLIADYVASLQSEIEKLKGNRNYFNPKNSKNTQNSRQNSIQNILSELEDL